LASKTVIVLLGIILVGSLVIRFPLLSVPLERDEGEYAYIAWRMSHGEIPYRDNFDQKPPGIFFLGKKLSGSSGAGLFSAAAFSIASAQPEITGQAANTEIFMLLPLVAGILVFVQRWGQCRKWDVFGVGMLIGLASLFKQVALATAIPIIIIQFYFDLKKGSSLQFRNALLSPAILSVGLITPWVPVLLFFAAHGAFGDLIQNVFLHNFRYLGTSRNELSLEIFLRNYSPIFRGEWPLWGAAVIGICAILVKEIIKGLFILLWLFSAAIGISASAYFFPHYFLQATPIQAVLAAIGITFLWTQFQKRYNLAGGIIVVLAAGFILIYPLVGNARMLMTATPSQISYHIYPGNIFPDTLRVAHHIRKNSSPTDTIFVVGSESQIPYYAKRRHVSRFHFLFPLFGNYPDAVDNQYEVYDSIVKERPKFIVVALNLLFFTENSERVLFKRLNHLLKQRYVLDGILFVKEGRIEHVNGESAVSKVAGQDPQKVLLQIFKRSG
jgi:hypothetical protein